MKRRVWRGILSLISSSVSSGHPHTCDLSPFSAKSGLKRIPLLHSLREEVTSASVLPRQELIPMPVTTTLRRPSTCMLTASVELRARARGDSEGIADLAAPERTCRPGRTGVEEVKKVWEEEGEKDVGEGKGEEGRRKQDEDATSVQAKIARSMA
eukprot:755677-Hanusia_phi.AAC.7